MPDFTIKGDPGAIRSRCATMRSKGTSFHEVADALDKINTDGWTGRAADKFRDKFKTEPEKWRQAGDGFIKAAGALEGYADALQSAQARAKQAAADYARGNQATHDAKNEYDASVSNARSKVEAARAAGRIMQLIIEPFHDPGAAIRQQAVNELDSAKSDLDHAAQACAAEVSASHAGAPNTRDWEHRFGLHAAEHAVKGAVESLSELGKLAQTFETFGLNIVASKLIKLATGDLTPEELAAQEKLTVEDTQALMHALRKDPGGVFKAFTDALIDKDTWSDHPWEAIGKLIPTIVLTVATLGSGSAAEAAADGAEATDTMAANLTEKAATLLEKANVADVAAESPYATPQMLDEANNLRASGEEASRAAERAAEHARSMQADAERLAHRHEVIEKVHDMHGHLEDLEEKRKEFEATEKKAVEDQRPSR